MLNNIAGLDPASIFALLASFGLSLSAGVRAYLPVLALGIASHFDGLGLHLRPGFEWIGSPAVIAVLAVLTIYEISADKIPVVDHLNDIVHTAIRPLSGAILFVATSNTLTDNGTTGLVIAALLGAGIAGTTHVAKAAVVRPASTATTMGLANPIVSLLEDFLAAITILLAIVAPVIGAILFVILAFVVIRGITLLIRRRRSNQTAIVTR